MKKTKLVGKLAVPGDKSISHRVLIFSSFCKGITKIEGLSPAQDCASTANCLRELGLKISDPQTDSTNGKRLPYINVEASGIKELSSPKNNLFVGNSGTTIRLLSGLLAGQPFTSELDGDESIRKRPMARVLEPLEKMGAHINYVKETGLAPFTIGGGTLQGREFKLKVASAQVQTALLLAGLQANGKRRYIYQVQHVITQHVYLAI